MKPVSKTAYYCCGVRALDAAAPQSVCGDQLAARFMTPDAWALFEPFRAFPEPNATNVVRHRIIDDILRGRLQSDPDTGVILVGAGFDTRPFRLEGGQWVELDEIALIEVKERQLPADGSSNPLTRVPIDFEEGSLGSALAPFRELPHPIIVLEGVLPYLEPPQIETLSRTLRSSFRQPTLICDLMTRAFARRYGGRLRAALGTLGARFAHHDREMREAIEAGGFRLVSRESIAGSAVALGALHVPRWLLATVFRGLRDGYAVATFEPDPADGAG